MKWWVAVLGVLVSIVSLRWSAQYLDNRNLPEAIRRTQGFHVLGKHWARIDNWRKDQGATPCDWSAKRRFPLVGGYVVRCRVNSAAIFDFEVTRDFRHIKPSDARTKAGIASLKTWAEEKRRWP